MNCGPLSDMILLGRPCNFHTLSLNNLTSPSANIFSVVEIKWTIFVSQFTTTKMALYPWAKGSLVIKSTDICIHGFSGIELGISLPADCSVQFLFLWQESHPSTYHFTSFVTPGHQKCHNLAKMPKSFSIFFSIFFSYLSRLWHSDGCNICDKRGDKSITWQKVLEGHVIAGDRYTDQVKYV